MNKITRTVLSLAMAGALLLGGAPFIAGCASTPQQVTFKTYATTRVSVQTAMSLWGAYVRNFNPSVDQQKAVKAAYEKWQAAMAAVADAGAVYAAADPASPTATQLFAAFSQAVTDAGVIQGDLLDAIQKFGVKL